MIVKRVREFLDKTDGSRKVILRLEDGELVESGLFLSLPGEPKNIRHLCLSCQVGCGMGCTHCVTGQKVGLRRNLNVEEILAQINYFCPQLKNKVLKVSFMGMGEVGLNAKNVIQAIENMNHCFPEIIFKGVVISTIGFVDFVKKCAAHNFNKDFYIGLHYSLLHPDEEKRKKIIVSSPSTITDMIEAGILWSKGQRVQIGFNIVMIEGYNDSYEVARQLVNIFKPFLVKFPEEFPPIVKISNFNDHGDVKWKGLIKEDIDRFECLLRTIVEQEGLEDKINIKRFESKGKRIDAGCGHFASRRGV